jgi:hypothetical protein
MALVRTESRSRETVGWAFLFLRHLSRFEELISSLWYMYRGCEGAAWMLSVVYLVADGLCGGDVKTQNAVARVRCAYFN